MKVFPTISAEAPSYSAFADDIECQTWLAEIDMAQYAETFLVNFGIGGNLLSRRRLGQIQLRHFPQMNIIQYDHQKRILQHIRHTLQFAYHSPVRKQEVEEKKKQEKKEKEKDKSLLLRQQLSKINIDPANRKANHKNQIQGRRRQSFDTNIWQSISRLRDAGESSLSAVEQLREGKFDSLAKDDTKTRRRRWTYGIESIEDKDGAPSRGIIYGNMAQEYDIMLRELNALQNDHLNHFKNLINCETANIFFVNEKSKELMLFADNIWFKIPVGSGICGHCAKTGESLNIKDAYSDRRFNRNIDVKTGFRTRNILCQPIRSHRQGGAIVGVIQMCNKNDPAGFDENDEGTLAICVQNVAEDLHARFKELTHLAAKFSGHAVPSGK